MYKTIIQLNVVIAVGKTRLMPMDNDIEGEINETQISSNCNFICVGVNKEHIFKFGTGATHKWPPLGQMLLRVFQFPRTSED